MLLFVIKPVLDAAILLGRHYFFNGVWSRIKQTENVVPAREKQTTVIQKMAGTYVPAILFITASYQLLKLSGINYPVTL
ncbi:hypothetical protein D7241_07160 [Stutzerimonas sp. VN223-3]|uniref:hypothetical protein n=1 Tax=Stutzerimonas sp. VN223-3 TaxID=3384601 RepID=UPI0038B47A84